MNDDEYADRAARALIDAIAALLDPPPLHIIVSPDTEDSVRESLARMHVDGMTRPIHVDVSREVPSGRLLVLGPAERRAMCPQCRRDSAPEPGSSDPQASERSA